MTGRARIPEPRAGVFQHRSLLQKQVATFVVSEQVHRPVAQIFCMDDRPFLLPEDDVVLVHDVEQFVSALRIVFQLMRIQQPR